MLARDRDPEQAHGDEFCHMLSIQQGAEPENTTQGRPCFTGLEIVPGRGGNMWMITGSILTLQLGMGPISSAQV